MNKAQIKEMIMELVGEIDYDIAKSYDPETAEEPEYCEERMDNLVGIVQKYLKLSKPGKQKSKNKYNA